MDRLGTGAPTEWRDEFSDQLAWSAQPGPSKGISRHSIERWFDAPQPANSIRSDVQKFSNLCCRIDITRKVRDSGHLELPLYIVFGKHCSKTFLKNGYVDPVVRRQQMDTLVRELIACKAIIAKRIHRELDGDVLACPGIPKLRRSGSELDAQYRPRRIPWTVEIFDLPKQGTEARCQGPGKSRIGRYRRDRPRNKVRPKHPSGRLCHCSQIARASGSTSIDRA